MQGLIGRKLGMTQVFDENGHRLPVTVIEAGPCIVVQRKTKQKDGYDAVQLGFGDQKPQRVTKAALGRFGKAQTAPLRYLREFAVDESDEIAEGSPVTVSIFSGVSHVNVTGISTGRGFQGVVKRHRMAGGPKTHGGHSKRRVGAIGQCSYPARVAKGQRMPGHMGRVQVTKENLRIVAVREGENLLLVHGSVAGPSGAIVLLKKAFKKADKGG